MTEKIKVEFEASTTGVEAGAKTASGAVSDAIAKMRESFGAAGASVKGMKDDFAGAFAGLRDGTESVDGLVGRFTKLGGVVGAVLGAAFVAAVRSGVAVTNEMTDEAVKLATQLGITAGEAGQLSMALGDVYVTTAEYSGLVTGMARNIKQNEAAINAMGLATRDANGNLRPTNELLRDGVKVLEGYRAGMDQSIAATQLFGRGATDVALVMRVANADMDAAREKAESLSLTITNDNVQANEKFKASMNDVGDVIQGMEKAIGDAFMPVLTKLGVWFAEIGPAAVIVVKGAFGGLAATFWALKNGVVVLWETIDAMVYSVAEPILALGRSLYKLVTGDFRGALDELTDFPARIGDKWASAMKIMTDSSDETSDRIYNLFARGDPSDAAKPGGDKSADVKQPKAEKVEKAKSRVPEWQDELRQQFAATKDYLADTTQAELEYWDGVSRRGDLSVEEQRAVTRELFTLNKKLASDKRAADLEAVTAAQQLDNAALAAKREGINQLLTEGAISATEGLRRLAEVKQEEMRIEREAVEAKLALVKEEGRERARLQNELKLLAVKEGAESLRANNAVANSVRASWAGVVAPVTQAFGNMVSGLLNGTMTFQQGIRSVLQSIGTEFLNMGVKMVTNWVANELAKTAATATGTAARGGIEAGGAALSVALWAGAALKNIMASAWEAMAGAYKAIVGIPFVGPVLAPIAAGVAFGAVAGIARSVASAEGGYDIPAGVNPLTQLHEREMVLPAKQADAVRDMAENGTTRSRGDTFNISAVDAAGVKRFLMDNGPALAASLRRQRANFAI